MAKPFIVSLPHQLGREEAKRRIATGIGSLEKEFGSVISVVDKTWTDDRFNFCFKSMGQTVSGHCDISDDNAVIEVQLPWMLAMIGEKARAYLNKEGTLLLQKKS